MADTNRIIKGLDLDFGRVPSVFWYLAVDEINP